MSDRILNSGYASYGAYELKATYQRHMLYGTGATALMVALGLFAAFVWSALTPAPVVTIGPCLVLSEVGDMGTPPTPIKFIVPRGGSPVRSHVDVEGWIPIPVADTEFVDDAASMVSYDRPAEFGNSDIDLLGSEAGNGAEYGDGDGDRFGIIGGTGDFLPPHDMFQAVEVFPQMVYQHYGDYPRLAKQAGIEGTVYVKALVDEEGKVMRVLIARSSGVDGLDKAAIEWAVDCRFSPGIQNGHAVKVWVLFKYDFQLDG